jgi:hypothetical protein
VHVRTYAQEVQKIKRRVDVKQAAEVLGISSEGIRQRIRRGSLESEKDTDGRVYVFLEEEALDSTETERSADALITRLEDEVEFLRRELATRDEEIRRRDAIMLSLSEGLKAINPPEAPEGSQRVDGDEPKNNSREASGEPQLDAQRRSWLYRFFFGL